MNNTGYGTHVIDRLIAKILDDEASDLLGAPIHSAIAAKAADAIGEGIRLRRSRGQSVEGQLAEVARMPRSRLVALCMERIAAVTS